MRKQTGKIILVIFFIAAIVLLRNSPVGDMITFENLKGHRETLLSFVHRHYALSAIMFSVAYLLVAALFIPGAAVLTLAGGFLFGVAASALYVNIGATTGASAAFLAARYLMGSRLQEKYQEQLRRFNGELERNGANYLLTVRLIPIFPFFLVNFLAGLTKIPFKTFLWTTSLGIIPGTVVYAFAGRQLGSVNSPADIMSKSVIIAFSILAAFTLVPAVLRRVRAAKKS